MYLITLLGNSILISISVLDYHLHISMYFLSNLSCLDIWYICVLTPMLANFFFREKHHLILRVCCPDVLLFGHGPHWVCALIHDGIWPICGHLQPSEITHHHEQECLCADCTWLLGDRLLHCPLSVTTFVLATPWTVAYQAPPSMEFSRQEYWSGVPLPSP